jgi:5-methylcytosine-specific restriction protein A
MAKEYSRKFYDSPAWRKVRKSYISHRQSIDGGLCECGCGELGYIVDHIKEITPDNINDTSITLSYSNLQYLSLACHNTKTFGHQEEKKYYFDEHGQIQPIPPSEN